MAGISPNPRNMMGLYLGCHTKHNLKPLRLSTDGLTLIVLESWLPASKVQLWKFSPISRRPTSCSITAWLMRCTNGLVRQTSNCGFALSSGDGFEIQGSLYLRWLRTLSG